MTVKKLRELLSTMDPDMEVFVHVEESDDFTYQLIDGLSSKQIPMREDPGGKVLNREWVVVLNKT